MGNERREVYFDNSATTQVFDCVRDVMVRTMTADYGNTSSRHLKGVAAESYIKEAREEIAKSLKVKEKEIISKEEAYKEITKGKFAYSEEGYGKLKNLTIKDIEIRYILDTKGFYVPIYIFNVIANTEHIEIGIKAIR